MLLLLLSKALPGPGAGGIEGVQKAGEFSVARHQIGGISEEALFIEFSLDRCVNSQTDTWNSTSQNKLFTLP